MTFIKKNLLLIVFCFALPIQFFLYWADHNRLYPQNDESAYFTLTQEIYQTFAQQGFLTAIELAYTHKHWKPIFHPVAAVPLLALTVGDTRQAITLYGGLCYLLLLAGLFQFLRKKIQSGFLIPTVVTIALMPWVFGLSTTFNSEIGFCTATIWFFFRWYDYGIFKNNRNATICALLLLFMFMLRPVETALVASFLVLTSLYEGFRCKQIFAGDLIQLLVWCAGFLSVVGLHKVLMAWLGSGFKPVLLAVFSLYGCYSLFAPKPYKTNRQVQIFSVLFFLPAFAWYLPGAHELYDWIVVANFDFLAKEIGQRYGRDNLTFLYFYIQKMGLMHFMLGALCVFQSWRTRERPFGVRHLQIFFSVILVPLAGGLASYNGDVRYYYSGWIIVLTLLFVEVARRHSRLSYVAVCLLCAITTISLYHPLHLDYRGYIRFSQLVTGVGFFSVRPISEDPNIKLMEQLTPLIAKKSGPAVIFHLSTTNNVVFDTNTFNVIGREKFSPISFLTRTTYLNLGDEGLNYYINELSGFLIVGPLESAGAEKKTDMVRLATDVSRYCKDPIKNPKPALIENYDFTQVVEGTYMGATTHFCFLTSRDNVREFKRWVH